MKRWPGLRHCGLVSIIALSLTMVSGPAGADVEGGLMTPGVPLQIGPVAGLTTAWHPAPKTTAIPLGTVVLFKTFVPPGGELEWIGAYEISRDGHWSVAECPILEAGPQQVRAVLRLRGHASVGTCALDAVEITPGEISITDVGMTYAALDIDENLPPDELNELTMDYYFGESVAAVTEVGNRAYRTSVDRTFKLNVQTNRPEFAPLIEWRLNGKPLTLLGTASKFSFNQIGAHAIEVGPAVNDAVIDVQTYRTVVTSHISGVDIVEEGQPIQFTAVTDPPGYEADITWLSSTLYGTARPVIGHGPTFTVEFNDTWGPYPLGGEWQWLGAKADNGVFNQDQKENCTFTQGYWKNHEENWPVNQLMLGNVNYTQSELLDILREPVQGNGLISLSYQLIAAKLNSANGADVPADVQQAVADADSLIGSLVVPPVGTDSLPTSQTDPVKDLLDEYNNGNAPGGPPHCD